MLFRMLIASVVLVVILLGSFWLLDQHGFFYLDKIEISLEGNNLSTMYLKPLVQSTEKKLSRFQGVSVWQLPLKEIAQILAEEQWIESTHIYRQWPSYLSIQIKPKEVKGLLLSRTGQLFPVVKDGSLLNPLQPKDSPDAILFQGENFFKNKDLRKKAVQTLEQIPIEGSFSRKNISEIKYQTRDGFWITLMKTGVQVKMGEEQIALKSGRVQQVIDYLHSHQIEARVIDANLSQKVLVKMRKAL